MCPNWQTEFFRGVALDMWKCANPPEQTAAEIDFLQKTLCTRESATLLDIACGDGRHSIGLARRGYHVVGVDQSKEALDQAIDEGADLPATFVEGDMCDLPWSAEFDGAYCFGNSFGYL